MYFSHVFLFWQVCAFTTGRSTLRARSGPMAVPMIASVWMPFLDVTSAQRSQSCFIQQASFLTLIFLGS